jgi:hypothetical protein
MQDLPYKKLGSLGPNEEILLLKKCGNIIYNFQLNAVVQGTQDEYA